MSQLLLLLPRLEASWLQHSCLTWPLLPRWLLRERCLHTRGPMLWHVLWRQRRCCLLRPRCVWRMQRPAGHATLLDWIWW
jgi:hypothetical protein